MTDNPIPDPAPAAPTPAPAPAAPARSGPRISWLTLVLALVATLVVGGFGGAAIASGVASAQTRTGFTGPGGTGGFRQNGEGLPGAGQGGAGAQGGTGAQGGAAGPGGFTAGTITKIDGDTITLTTRGGQTVTVTTTGDTTVTKAEEGKVSDLKKGDTVTVRGQSTNGTVTAERITEGELGGPGAR